MTFPSWGRPGGVGVAAVWGVGWGGVERWKKGGWVVEREKEEEKIDKKPQNTARQKEGMPSVHCSQAFVCEKKGLWFNSVFVQFCLREQASCHRTEEGGMGGGDVGDGGTGGRGDEGGGSEVANWSYRHHFNEKYK